jgi:beta-lactam-binding protein with PASTA domain
MRRLARGLLFFTGLGIATLILILLILDLAVMPGIVEVEKVRVPDLRQLPLDKALRRLENRGLRLAVRDSLFQEVLALGTVVDQTPHTGQRIKQGRRVFVDVSKGPRLFYVPDLKQKSLRQAEILLKDADLRLGSWRYTSTLSLSKDAIVRQVPRPGVPLKRNGQVDLEISSGPPDALKKVPKVVGLLINVVEDSLQKYEMDLGRIEERVDSRRPAGVVVRQLPAAGSRAPRLSKIDLVITAREQIVRRDSVTTQEP